MTKNNISLSQDELRELVPSAFAKTQSQKVSNKYTFISTTTVLDDMSKLGWEPFNAAQRKSRKSEDAMFTKHMIRLRNGDVGKVGDSIPEVVLTNSHDGRNAFNLHAGLFRLVCSNGLVIADTTFEQVKIKHQWYTMNEVKKTTEKVLVTIPKIINRIDSFQNTELNNLEKNSFAKKAVYSRWKDGNDYITSKDMLVPIRDEDSGDSLWQVLNVVQEKILRGGITYNLNSGRQQTVRALTNIDQRIEVNKRLWSLAEDYVS